jgi:hypothetical protein
MRVRTFTGYLPLDIEVGINKWLDDCKGSIIVQQIHYAEGTRNDDRVVSALVEYITHPNFEGRLAK